MRWQKDKRRILGPRTGLSFLRRDPATEYRGKVGDMREKMKTQIGNLVAAVNTFIRNLKTKNFLIW
jgi:hypothetical protein